MVQNFAHIVQITTTYPKENDIYIPESGNFFCIPQRTFSDYCHAGLALDRIYDTLTIKGMLVVDRYANSAPCIGRLCRCAKGGRNNHSLIG